MGGAASSTRALEAHEVLLEQLSGPAPIAADAAAWGQLRSLRVSLATQPPALVAERLAPYARQLMVNNPCSHNFQQLMLHALDLASRKPSLAAANALHLVSAMLKFTIETASPSALSMVFEVAPSLPAAVQGQQTLLPMFLNRLVLLLCNLQPTDEASYLLLLEALLLLLVCASTQLYTQQTAAPIGSQPLLEALMGQPQAAPALVSALLALVVGRAPQPAKLALYAPPAEGAASVMRLVRTAAATVLWIPLRTYQFIVRHGPGPGEGPPSPLSDLALALLLVLAHYPAHHASLPNGVKEGLQGLQDAASPAGAEPGRVLSPASLSSKAPAASFSKLYDYFATGPQSEGSTLLLYTLLHGSKSFQEYVLVRSDPETLLLPVLAQLYAASKSRANHLYMLQIIVLILSQDTSFSHNIHKVLLPGPIPWYRERVLSRLSLGSLAYIVLLRTAHRNIGQMQDLYLPTNTLAALANLAPQVSGLHSHAAQRLVGLTASLARRWMKLNAAAAEAPLAPPPQELQVLADFLRILLGSINCSLTLNLGRNPELVYALLHRQEVFRQLQGQAGFAELADNLLAVIDWFNARLDGVRAEHGGADAQGPDWSVERVLDLVQRFSQSWRGDRLRHTPELRFVYEEEASPEDFFVPAVWGLAVATTGGRLLTWSLGQVSLLQAAPEAPASGDGSLEGQTSNLSRWSEADAYGSGELAV